MCTCMGGGHSASSNICSLNTPAFKDRIKEAYSEMLPRHDMDSLAALGLPKDKSPEGTIRLME